MVLPRMHFNGTPLDVDETGSDIPLISREPLAIN
jgi:hypothetical protein